MHQKAQGKSGINNKSFQHFYACQSTTLLQARTNIGMTLKADSFHTNTFKFYLGDSLRSKQVHVRDDAIFPFVDELFWGK